MVQEPDSRLMVEHPLLNPLWSPWVGYSWSIERSWLKVECSRNRTCGWWCWSFSPQTVDGLGWYGLLYSPGSKSRQFCWWRMCTNLAWQQNTWAEKETPPDSFGAIIGKEAIDNDKGLVKMGQFSCNVLMSLSFSIITIIFHHCHGWVNWVNWKHCPLLKKCSNVFFIFPFYACCLMVAARGDSQDAVGRLAPALAFGEFQR